MAHVVIFILFFFGKKIEALNTLVQAPKVTVLWVHVCPHVKGFGAELGMYRNTTRVQPGTVSPLNTLQLVTMQNVMSIDLGDTTLASIP